MQTGQNLSFRQVITRHIALLDPRDDLGQVPILHVRHDGQSCLGIGILAACINPPLKAGVSALGKPLKVGFVQPVVRKLVKWPVEPRVAYHLVMIHAQQGRPCLLYTSDAADE